MVLKKFLRQIINILSTVNTHTKTELNMHKIVDFLCKSVYHTALFEVTQKRKRQFLSIGHLEDVTSRVQTQSTS